jgi:hypothetical protein
VSVHDFPHLGEGKAIPYGAYDIARNRAVVNIGITRAYTNVPVTSRKVAADRHMQAQWP